MKVTFTGKPEKIKREMHEFLGYDNPADTHTHTGSGRDA